MSGGPTLFLVADSARASPEVPLDDLPGEGGRFDLVARFVNASLLTSHGIREDASAIVAFTRGEDPLALRVRGEAVTGIGPDERSTAARLAGALDAVPMPVWQEVEDGIELRSGNLAELLDDAPRPLIALHEEGGELPADAGEGTLVVGDHEGFTDEQRALLREEADALASLGESALQADHVAAILHHELGGS